MSTEIEELMIKIGGVPKSKTKGPGGRGTMAERKGLPKSNKRIGSDYEDEKLIELKAHGINARKGKQNIAGIGDVGEGDLNFSDWMIECKKHRKSGFTKATKQTLENTPTWAHGAVVVEEHAVDWLCLKWKERLEFAVSYCDAAGFDVIPRLKSK